MSSCGHDLADMDTAAHWDGLCPLCLEQEVERLRGENERLRGTYTAKPGSVARQKALEQEVERLREALVGDEGFVPRVKWLLDVVKGIEHEHTVGSVEACSTGLCNVVWRLRENIKQAQALSPTEEPR